MTKNIELTEWYFIRHAPVKNARKGIYSHPDGDAILPSEKNVKAMVSSLPKNALWFVSPLKRTKQTAEILRSHIENPGKIFYEEALKEQNFGNWQGLSFEEIWQSIKDLEPHNWSLLAADTVPPNGESFSDLQKRVKPFLEKIIYKNPSQPKILVTHAGVIRSIIGTVLNLKNDDALSIGIDPFSLSIVLHQTGEGKGGQWQLKLLNQTYES